MFLTEMDIPSNLTGALEKQIRVKDVLIRSSSLKFAAFLTFLINIKVAIRGLSEASRKYLPNVL